MRLQKESPISNSKIPHNEIFIFSPSMSKVVSDPAQSEQTVDDAMPTTNVKNSGLRYLAEALPKS